MHPGVLLALVFVDNVLCKWPAHVLAAKATGIVRNVVKEVYSVSGNLTAAHSQHCFLCLQMKLEKSKQEHAVQSAMEAQERNFGRITRSLSGEAL